MKIAELINKEDIAIALFMEMDGGSYRTRNKNYMETLSAATGLKNNAFYPTHRLWWNLANQGNGILSRYDILEARNEKLESRLEDRYLSISILKIDKAHSVTVLTTQLALGRKSRAKELRHIAQVINSIKGPVIFAGDLNVHNAHELDILKDTRLKRVETSKTFPTWKPKWRLDYMYYSPEFDLVNSYVLDSFKVSDHLPIVAELRLKR